MRINDGDAVAGQKIGHNHVAHERGLADTGFAEDRHVFMAHISGTETTVFVLSEEDFHEMEVIINY